MFDRESFFADMIQHFAALPADQLDQMRQHLQRKYTRTESDARGKAAFLDMLDRAEAIRESRTGNE